MKSLWNKIVVALLIIVATVSYGKEFEVHATETSINAAVLQVSNYEIEEGTLLPGTEVNLVLYVRNDGNMIASSAMVTLSSSSGMVYPVYGDDNQVYIGDVLAGETKKVEIPLKVNKNFNLDTVDVTCTITYVTSGKGVTNPVLLAIPSSTGHSLDMTNIKVAQTAVVGGNSLISAKLVNSTGNDITDAKLVITGNVDPSTKEIDLGTVSAGNASLRDYYITFVEAGEQEISILLEYTDARGNSYSIDEGKYSIHVDEISQTEVTQNSVVKWAGLVVAVILAFAVLVIVIKYMKKHI